MYEIWIKCPVLSGYLEMYHNISDYNPINYPPKEKYFIAVVGIISLLTINMCRRTVTHMQIPWFHTQVDLPEQTVFVKTLYELRSTRPVVYFHVASTDCLETRVSRWGPFVTPLKLHI